MEYQNKTQELIRQRFEALTENDVAILDEMEHLEFDSEFRTYGYGALLCLDGRATCRVGDKTFELGKNDVFFCRPNLFVENAMASFDFKSKILLMSPNYFENIFLLLPYRWNSKFVINDNPLIHLSEEEKNALEKDFYFLRDKLAAPATPHRHEMIQLLLQSLIYEFFDCIEPKLKIPGNSFSSSEVIFCRFMELVSEGVPLHRRVDYYADALCLTPKYLSSVCKQQAGRTAFEIINNLTVEYIKRMIRTTGKSIKEVSVECGFSNVSFFGKYVRRELGMSPREYRLQQNELPG